MSIIIGLSPDYIDRRRGELRCDVFNALALLKNIMESNFIVRSECHIVNSLIGGATDLYDEFDSVTKKLCESPEDQWII